MDNSYNLAYFADRGITARKGQTLILNAIIANPDKKYYIIQAPTGVGKSHIGTLCALQSKMGSYIVTTSKQLQKEYLKYHPTFEGIEGKGNYPCNLDGRYTVETSFCNSYGRIKSDCLQHGICGYYTQLAKAISAPTTCTNYAFLMSAMQSGLATNFQENVIPLRETLVLDEAHEIEKALLGFSQLSLDVVDMKKTHGIDVSINERTLMDDLIALTKLVMDEIDNVSTRAANIANKIGDPKTIIKTGSGLLNDLNDRMRALKAISGRLGLFIEEPEANVIFDVQEGIVKLSLKKTGGLFKKTLGRFAEKIYMMSATIGPLDTFCASLGLDPSEVCYVEAPSEFESALSPINIIPVGRMSFKELDRTLPTVILALETLLHEHENDKGIIHTGNYKIAEYILKNLPRPHKHRLIARDSHSGMKIKNEDLVRQHTASANPTVLLSPSLTTGVDLADDLSRFQVVVKLPFLGIGDKRVATLMKEGGSWYEDQMWVTLMQACGRSTRNESDYSTTYILDEAFLDYFRKSKGRLPGWFVERVSL